MKKITFKNYFYKKVWLVIVLTISGSNLMQAQNGINDSTFNILDEGANAIIKGTDGAVTVSAIQLNNNKIIIAGSFTKYNNAPANHLTRLNINGNIDNSFDVGTGLNGVVKTLVIQADYKVLVGGYLTMYNNQPINNLIRLNANGKIDNTFKIGTSFNGQVNCVAIQQDGKILVGGNFSSYNGISVNGLVRLNKNGSLDDLFNLTKPYTSISKLVLQADGKIIIGYGRSFLKRLNQNGILDNSFNYEPFSLSGETDLETMVIQQDGKILVGGSGSLGNNYTVGYVFRYNTNGQIDSTFEYGGAHRFFEIHSLTVQSDGKIYVSGKQGVVPDYHITRNLVRRLLPNGKIDSTFFEVNKVNERVCGTYTISIQPDGKIIVGGFFQNLNTYTANNLIRLNSDGTPDIAFNKTTGANGTIRACDVQKNGKIIIGGDFYGYQYKSRNHIARLTKDGKLDNSFDPGLGANGPVYAIAIQTNNQIIIGGDFTSYNGTSVNNIARLNTDGSIDSGFHIGTGINGIVYTITLHSNGKLLIGGDFNKVNEISRNSLVRLNTDGYIDNSFVGPPLQSFNNDLLTKVPIYSILVLPSNKIVIGGSFNGAISGKSYRGIMRLNDNGDIDTSFTSLARNEIVQTCALQADGKIIIGGGRRETETQYYGFTMRMNSNGTADNTFTRTQTLYHGYQPYVQSISLLENNKILVGGRFTNYDDKNVNHIVLLNNDGTVDSNFVGNANGDVWTMRALKENKVIVAGGFTSFNGISKNRIVSILFSAPTCKTIKSIIQDSPLIASQKEEIDMYVYPNPSSSIITIDQLEVGGILTITDVLGRIVYNSSVTKSKIEIDLEEYLTGTYFVNYILAGKIIGKKISILNN